MDSMKHRFKADLSGWLEYNSNQLKKKQTPTSDLLIESFDSTLKDYNFSNEAKEALHCVIFYAVVNDGAYATDFDVPRFSHGLTYGIYADVIAHFKLHTFTKRELWKGQLALAMEFIELLHIFSKQDLSAFYETQLQLIFEFDEESQFSHQAHEFVKRVTKDNSNKNCLFLLINAIKNIVDNALHISKRQPDKKSIMHTRIQRSFGLLFLLQRDTKMSEVGKHAQDMMFAIYHMIKDEDMEAIEALTILYRATRGKGARPVEPTPKPLNIEIAPQSLMPLDEYLCIREDQEPGETEHEYLFRSIVSYILQKYIPNNNEQHYVEEEQAAFDRLSQIIQAKGHDQLLSIKLGCISIIQKRDMFWKSVLKIMVQFMDLWISDILEAKCADIIASLIAHENMMMDLYKHILKHVKHQNQLNNLQLIKSLTKLLELCFVHVESNQVLKTFRDNVFISRDDNPSLPTFGSCSLWNIPFNQEIIKLSNQITSQEDEQVSDTIIKYLLILSIVWPYEVVRQLFLTCIQNKHQYKAIVPVLHKLGHLVVLKCQGSRDTLLMRILVDFVSPQNHEMVEAHMMNSTQFIKYCCMYEKEFIDPKIPLILKSNSLVNLLNLKDVLNNCVLDNITSFLRTDDDKQLTSLRFALQLLAVFCEPWIPIVQDLPVVLYCSPEAFLICFTQILSLRDTKDKHILKFQDYELVLQIVKLFSTIVASGLQSNLGDFPLLACFFTETLHTFDWKSQMLWYDVSRDMSRKPIKIPHAFFRLTGALDDVFVCDDNILSNNKKARELDGWYDLFTACRISTRLTDELFEHSEQWMYNLLLLWKHPHEDNIIEPCLRHTLHPATSLSVSNEYPNLLIHFLGKLYDSFMGIHSLMRNYQVYEHPGMTPIIRDLTNEGTKQFFILIYINSLLSHAINNKDATYVEENSYYISNLIKVMQGLKNWGSISRPGQINTYAELKAKTKPYLSATTSNTFSVLVPNTDPKTVHYPLLYTAELLSDRALSILTLYHLCSLLNDTETVYKLEQAHLHILSSFIFQIIEGLIDTTSKQSFQRMLQQQPKGRITNWEASESSTKFIVKMRPILLPVEEEVLAIVIGDALPNAHRISQALGLTAAKKGKHVDRLEKQCLYFN